MPSLREPAQYRAPHILTPSQRQQLETVAGSWDPLTPGQRARLRPLLAGTLDLDRLARDLGHPRGVRWDLRGDERTRRTYGDPHPGDHPGEAA